MEPENKIPGSEQELHALVEDAIALGKENNRLIRRMIRMGRIAFWSKVVVWIFVLGLPILFIGPIMTFIDEHTSSASLFGYPSPAQIQNFLGHTDSK